MDEIVELMARGIAAAKMGLDNHGQRLPDDLWRQADEHAQRALSALHEAGYEVRKTPELIPIEKVFTESELKAHYAMLAASPVKKG